MAARLGNVLYWLGCIVAAVAVVYDVTLGLANNWQDPSGTYIRTAILAVAAWLVGRACRYVLSGSSQSSPLPMTDKRKSLGRAYTRDGFSQGTGQLTGRDKDAQARLEKRAAQLQADGMSAEDAKRAAREEMRDNPREDWRAG